MLGVRREPQARGFNCYGENAFTFLAFQALEQHGLIRTLLLANLKGFGTDSRKFPLTEIAEIAPEVWLFPNFGKRHGFGEPDAVVLIGQHTFWFEVETSFDVARRLPALNQSMRQLFRFHLFLDALANGERTRRTGGPHWAVMGPTVTDAGFVKQGVLRIANHPALRPRLRRAMIESYRAQKSHYVLMCHAKPKGPGSGENFGPSLRLVFQSAIGMLGGTLSSIPTAVGLVSNNIPSMPKEERFWYVYWRGDLESKYLKTGNADPLKRGGYTGRKARR